MLGSKESLLGGQKREALELELEQIEICQLWMLRIHLRFLARVVVAFNLLTSLAAPPAPSQGPGDARQAPFH